jgi:hypothetical protein
VSEVVKVTAEATPVQTASSERSGLLDTNQVTNLMHARLPGSVLRHAQQLQLHPIPSPAVLELPTPDLAVFKNFKILEKVNTVPR